MTTVTDRSDVGSAAPLRGASLQASPDAVEPSGGADPWEEGRVAARAGDHARALDLYTREAEQRGTQGRHGRAAIAFRMASEQARLVGEASLARTLLVSAADAYAAAAERDDLPAAGRRRALVAATTCYLSVEDLDQAARCIQAARTDEVTESAVARAS